MLLRRRTFLAMTLGTATLLGCGGGKDVPKDRVPVFKVKGKVMLGTAPLDGATVKFEPFEGQLGAAGTTDKNGEFVLNTYDSGDGAAAGKYRVAIIKSEVVPDAPVADVNSNDYVPPEQQKAAKPPKSLVPPKYNSPAQSGLEATVTAEGPNEFTFDLKP